MVTARYHAPPRLEGPVPYTEWRERDTRPGLDPRTCSFSMAGLKAWKDMWPIAVPGGGSASSSTVQPRPPAAAGATQCASSSASSWGQSTRMSAFTLTLLIVGGKINSLGLEGGGIYDSNLAGARGQG